MTHITEEQVRRALEASVAAVIDPAFWNQLPPTEATTTAGGRRGTRLLEPMSLADFEAHPSMAKARKVIEIVVAHLSLPDQEAGAGLSGEIRGLIQADRERAYTLADKLLDVPNSDPDDDPRTLARQLLRQRDWLIKLADALDLANRKIGELEGKEEQ